MHDLPTGPQLLALARAVLLEELMPLLPQEHRFDALLIGNCLAIVGREAAAAGGPAPAIDSGLRSFYGERPTAPATRFERAFPADATPPVAAGSAADVEEPDLWRRFAKDLRAGAIAGAPDCDAQARTILWRLTIAKLRLANPRFLAANGFAGGDRPGGQTHVA